VTEDERKFTSYGVLPTEGNSKSGLGYVNVTTINNQKVQNGEICWRKLFASSIRNGNLEAGAGIDSKCRMSMKMILEVLSTMFSSDLDGVRVNLIYCGKFYSENLPSCSNQVKLCNRERMLICLKLFYVCLLMLILMISEVLKKLMKLGAKTLGCEFCLSKDFCSDDCSEGEENIIFLESWKKELQYEKSRLIDYNIWFEFIRPEEQSCAVPSWFSIFIFPSPSLSKSNNCPKKHPPAIVGQWSPSSSEDG
jgi:hypothetical protein